MRGVGEREGLRLLRRLAEKMRHREDCVQSAYAILKILPEGNAQLAAGLLQADEGVTAAPAQFTNALIGAALAEGLGIFSLVVALLLLFT